MTIVSNKSTRVSIVTIVNMQKFNEPTEAEKEACAAMLCEWVKMMRERSQMTQEDFGAFVGVNKSAISMVENQVRTATPDLMAKITFAFEVDALSALELIWSAALEHEIILPRGSDGWVYRLQPLVKALPEEALNQAIGAFKGSIEGYHQGQKKKNANK